MTIRIYLFCTYSATSNILISEIISKTVSEKNMDLSPAKRFDHRVKMNVKDINEKKDGVRNSVEYKVQEAIGKSKQPMGLFSGGRMSNLSSTITKEDQDVARKRGDQL